MRGTEIGERERENSSFLFVLFRAGLNDLYSASQKSLESEMKLRKQLEEELDLVKSLKEEKEVCKTIYWSKPVSVVKICIIFMLKMQKYLNYFQI